MVVNGNENERYCEIVQNSLLNLLNNSNVSVGQKLFVLNIYIENLNDFGNKCLLKLRGDFLNIFIKWPLDIIVEFKYKYLI